MIAGLKHQWNKIPVDDPEVIRVSVRAVIYSTESSDNQVDSVERLLFFFNVQVLKKRVVLVLKIKETLFLRIQHKTQLKVTETWLGFEES